MAVKHSTHPSCGGEKCTMCQSDASHKVGEEQHFELVNMHNFTAYVCCDCFGKIMGPAAVKSCTAKGMA